MLLQRHADEDSGINDEVNFMSLSIHDDDGGGGGGDANSAVRSVAPCGRYLCEEAGSSGTGFNPLSLGRFSFSSLCVLCFSV